MSVLGTTEHSSCNQCTWHHRTFLVQSVYLAPQNIPRAIRVLTLGNKVILYGIVLYCSYYHDTCNWITLITDANVDTKESVSRDRSCESRSVTAAKVNNTLLREVRRFLVDGSCEPGQVNDANWIYCLTKSVDFS